MSKTPGVQAINAALEGAKDLLAFDLKHTPGGYTLHLTLGRKGIPAATVLCTDVQNLELNPTGDGFEQMYTLLVTDMRDDGLDRIHYSIEELERETIFLHCAGIQLIPTL
jgi:hypothetical protein